MTSSLSGRPVETRGSRPVARAPASSVLVLALLAAVSPLATALALPGFTRMASDLSTDAASVQLTLTTFLAGLAVGQLVIGPISDRSGRRAPLLIGAAACVLASVVCAIAPTITVLIAARCVQGFTGAAGIVLGRAMVADRDDGPGAARTFSVLMTIGAVAPVLAPLAGGVLLTAFGWRGVFAALAVVTAAMFLGALLVLPETLPPERRRAGGMSALVRGARSVSSSVPYVGNGVVFAASYAVLIGYVSASPFVLQVRFGLSPTQYSIVFASNAVGLVVGGLVNARIVVRTGPRRPLAVGLAVQLLCAAALVALSLSGALALAPLLVLLWCSVTSLGFIMANATSLALAPLSDGVGVASALLGTAQFGLAAIVAPLVGLAGEHDVRPMAVVMAVAAVTAAGAFVVANRSGRSARSAPAAPGAAPRTQ